MKTENKKRKFIAIYILLIIGSIGIINFPSSYSYFTREEKSTLTYKMKLYNLSYKLPMILEQAKESTAQFKLSFKPSSAAISGQNDQYYIEIPDTCTFDHTDIIESVTDNNAHLKTVTFNQNSNRNRSNYVYINCPIEKNKDVKFIAKINAKFSDKSPKFTYIEYSYEESYNDYLKHVNEVVESKVSISKDSDIFAEFKKWISNYAVKEGFTDISDKTKNPILNYVNQVFKTKEDIINPNNFNALPGLSIVYDEAVGEYIFKIVDNFVGYARTYSSRIENEPNIILYFSTTSKEVIENAFEEYTKKYIFPNSSTSAKLLQDYIKQKGGISSVIVDGKTIEGTSLQTKDSKNSSVLLYKGSILSLALTIKENTPCVAPSDSGTMLHNDFPRALQIASGLSSTVMQDIYYRDDIQKSIVKNNTNTTPKSFTDYFVHQDGNKYYLIKISSDITNDPIYNRVTIDDITIPSGTNVTFNDSANYLTINITNTSQATVTQAVNTFNTYFKTTNNNLIVKTNTANNYTVELKYAK